MAYSSVYVFGDSLVDAGNALKLAEWYGDLTFSDLPDGAPAAEDGYFQGRFTDGYTFADLLSNKAIGSVTRPVFPYGFEDPWIGLPIAPFAGDPNGNNLNFAYGGAQVRQGDEVVQDLDSQTDTFRDAVDGDAPGQALYIVTMGGNDVRSLADNTSAPADTLSGYIALDRVVDQLIHELGQLIDDGARNFLITGSADVGLIPDYDINNNGLLDPAEQVRADAATLFSQYLDLMIRTEVVEALEGMGATVTYVSIMDGLDAIMPTLEALHGLAPGALTTDLLQHRDLVFFDDIHPTAQVHALFGSYAQALLTGGDWTEILPLAGGDVDYALTAGIAAAGEVDRTVISLVAGTEYRFEVLGMSSLGIAGSLADPALRLLTSGGMLAGGNADDGAGFDPVLTFTAAASGNHTLEISATGNLTGSYLFQAAVVGGAAMAAGNTYSVTSPTTVVLEGAGGIGQDVVSTSTSYALTPGSEIELLTTSNAKGKTAINLTGNDFAQAITGNAGANVVDGKSGNDTLTGGGGKDVFVLAANGSVDRIADYERGEVVDITQALSVAGGTNVVSGSFVRVTTGGLIQVDTTGGGNDWLTLGTVGGNSAVTLRYLSGGSATNVTVSRVAANSLLAATAAAAGLMAMPVAAQGGDGEAAASGSLAAMAAFGFQPALHGDTDSARPMLGGELREFAVEPALSNSPAGMPVGLAAEPMAVGGNAWAGLGLTLSAGTELPVAAPLAAWDAVGMPAPAMAGAPAEGKVAELVAELIGGAAGAPGIEALLGALPGAAAGPEHGFAAVGTIAELAVLQPVMGLQPVGLEMLAMHADAPATV